MKRFKLFLILFVSLSLSASAQIGGDSFKLPETWEKDFVIKLSFQGSMGGGNTDILLTHDSITYVQGAISYKKARAKSGKGKMKDSYRVAILKRLHELKVDQVKSERVMGVVNDGWSQSICFDFYCLEGGSSVEMSIPDKNAFLDTYRYLEEFAKKHTRSAKR